MSFLTENIVRQVTLIPRIIARQSPRAFSTSLVFNRTATEAIKDGAKSIDRAVSDKLVDGINATGELFLPHTHMSPHDSTFANEIRGGR